MKISQDGLAVKKYFESCKLIAYADPGSKNGLPWTIGWGHTGPEVVKGLVWTQEQADAALVKDCEKFEMIAQKEIKVPLTQGQFDAMVDILFNTGPGAKGIKDGIITLKSGQPSTLLRKLNAADYAGAAEEFLRWNKNDGKVMLGLCRRRAANRALFLGKNSVEAIKEAQAIK